ARRCEPRPAAERHRAVARELAAHRDHAPEAHDGERGCALRRLDAAGRRERSRRAEGADRGGTRELIAEAAARMRCRTGAEVPDAAPRHAAIGSPLRVSTRQPLPSRSIVETAPLSTTSTG